MDQPQKRIAMFNIHSDPMVAIGTQENGGQNVYVRSLMNELDRLGWAVDVYTRWNDPRKKHIVPVGKNSRVIRLKGGPLAHVPKFELHAHLPEFYKNFLEFIGNQNTYDVFHGHYWDGGWVAIQASEQFKRPFIQTYHSLGKVRFDVKQKYSHQNGESQFEERFRVEEEIGQKAAKVIVLSENEKEDLVSLYGIPAEKIIIIPGAVNFRVFQPMAREYARAKLGLHPTDFTLLYVGRLEWRKGIGTMISALAMLKNDIPNIRAIVVGGGIMGKQKNDADYKEYQRLVEKATSEGVVDRIQFVGRVSHSRVKTYYSASNVHVVPSYYEPFGLVALEGMACQVPVVASRKGGLVTTINDGVTGLLFEPRNAQDLQQKILSLHKDPILLGNIVRDAYDHVKKYYSWKDIAIKIENVYETIQKEPGQS